MNRGSHTLLSGMAALSATNVGNIVTYVCVLVMLGHLVLPTLAINVGSTTFEMSSTSVSQGAGRNSTTYNIIQTIKSSFDQIGPLQCETVCEVKGDPQVDSCVNKCVRPQCHLCQVVLSRVINAASCACCRLMVNCGVRCVAFPLQATAVVRFEVSSKMLGREEVLT